MDPIHYTCEVHTACGLPAVDLPRTHDRDATTCEPCRAMLAKYPRLNALLNAVEVDRPGVRIRL